MRRIANDPRTIEGRGNFISKLKKRYPEYLRFVPSPGFNGHKVTTIAIRRYLKKRKSTAYFQETVVLNPSRMAYLTNAATE
mgnify:CR=1 FL=1